MSTIQAEAPTQEHVDNACAEDAQFQHKVCHCRDYNLTVCGLNASGMAWAEPEEDVCPMCELEWPDDALTCPWGCDCEECGPDEDDPFGPGLNGSRIFGFVLDEIADFPPHLHYEVRRHDRGESP